MSEDQQELQWLGALFRKLRLKKGWTLEQTEEHGWHDWKYLQKIENGRNITIMTFFKLCELYGVKSDRILKSFETTFKL